MVGRHVPVYGMNCGSVGFLMNAFSEDDLTDRLRRAQEAILHPLRMHAVTTAGAVEEALAFNEVSLLRQLRQAAKIRISVDGRVRLPELICDGILDFDASRLDGLQSLGAWPDRAAVGEPTADDADQCIPPPPLARRAAPEHRRCSVRGPGRRQASGRGGRRFHRGARRHLGRGQRGPQRADPRVLFDPDQGLSERIIAEQFTA